MANNLYTGTDKRYKERDVAKIAGRINSYTRLNKDYKLSEMADGVDEAAEAAAEEKEAVTRAIIDRSITEIVIPEGVTKIGNYCFIQCFSLERIKIPNTVTSIGGYALGINNLTSLELPDSVIDIGNSCIYSCTKLESITFGKSLSKITVNNFNELPNCVLYNFSRCEQVPELGGSPCFRGINPDARILVPPELYNEWVVATNWAEYAEFITYKASEGLEITRIDDWGNVQDYYTVKGIGSCTDSFIAIPSSYDDGVHGKAKVSELGAQLLAGNTTVTEIYLPTSIQGFGQYQLNNCPSLKKIYMPGVTAISSFECCNLPSLEFVKFGSNFDSLDSGTFAGCSSVTYDFTDCTQVPRFDSYGPGLEFGEDPVIRVPAALYEEWKADTNWTNYADYIVAAE